MIYLHQCHQQLNYPARPANRLRASCGHLSSTCPFKIAPPHPHHLPNLALGLPALGRGLCKHCKGSNRLAQLHKRRCLLTRVCKWKKLVSSQTDESDALSASIFTYLFSITCRTLLVALARCISSYMVWKAKPRSFSLQDPLLNFHIFKGHISACFCRPSSSSSSSLPLLPFQSERDISWPLLKASISSLLGTSACARCILLPISIQDISPQSCASGLPLNSTPSVAALCRRLPQSLPVHALLLLAREPRSGRAIVAVLSAPRPRCSAVHCSRGSCSVRACVQLEREERYSSCANEHFSSQDGYQSKIMTEQEAQAIDSLTASMPH